jgi:hypothetical protein
MRLAHQMVLDGGTLAVKIWMGQKNQIAKGADAERREPQHTNNLRIVKL